MRDADYANEGQNDAKDIFHINALSMQHHAYQRCKCNTRNIQSSKIALEDRDKETKTDTEKRKNKIGR